MNRSSLQDCSSAVSVNSLVFSGGETWCEDELDSRATANLQTLAPSMPGPSSDDIGESGRSGREQNISTYVRVFEDMVCTVIREDIHLLSDEEFALLTVFAHLSYNARYLMVKLLLRKQDTWHRLDTLKYEGELGSVSAIACAIDELCCVGSEPSSAVKREELVGDTIIDLIMDEIDTNPQQEQLAFVNARALDPSAEDRPLALARGEREMDLKSLLECLRLDELKAVAKQLKLKTNLKKNDLVKELLCASSLQSTLTNFTSKGDATPSKGRGCHQSKLPFGKLKSQQDRLRDMALRYIVKCVRVDQGFFGVIHRVNLVYFRMTYYAPGILVAALLTRFGKRAYPGYDYERTKNVWPTRQALLNYEEVLVLEGQVDALLAGSVPPLGGRAFGTETPAKLLPTSVTPKNASSSKRGEALADEGTAPDIKPDSIRVLGARLVRDIFDRVYPRWMELVTTESDHSDRVHGLERFHCGHVLTRIICKGSTALGILGEHEQELEVLEALLAQKRWRRGRRGRWHERRALIISTYLPNDEKTTEQALDAVIDALRDPDTHIVFRPKLQRRLRRLENKLKIPVQERHTCDGALEEADKVVFEAIRLKHRAASLKLDRTGRCIVDNTPHERNQDIKRYYSPTVGSAKSGPNSHVAPASHGKTSSDTPKGKSLWLGRNGEELTVESLALQRYEDQGFKGVHSETRIISMLFGLLFWDIIFTPIPGAFETPYQTAPLDITEDSFYHARKDLMEERLAAIEAGKGASLIRNADAKNRASETWCVGVQWDLLSSEDLVNIVTCIGGKALSVICRVLCEDYTFGTSGGPDLFLWNNEKGTCKFAEVKGPGDSLQENQRIWIDILLKAPIAVEICHVVESGDETDGKLNVRTPKSARKKARRAPRKKEEVVVDTENADTLPEFHGDLDGAVEEQPVPTDACSQRDNPDRFITTFSATAIDQPTHLEGASSPLKRKASPLGATSFTPSKRTRTS